MSIAVRLIYPSTTTQFSYEANFLNYGNPYVYKTNAVENGLVDIALKAEIYSPDGSSIAGYSLSKIHISNDENFLSEYIVLDYISNYYYVIEEISRINLIGNITLSSWGTVPTVGSPPFGHAVLQDAEIQENVNNQDLLYILNWPVSVGEGEKIVYVRFVYTKDDVEYLFPVNGPVKAFFDTIIWQISSPSTPGQPMVLNRTDNNYVPDNLLWIYSRSQDLLSGLDSYSVNKIAGPSVSFEEDFDDNTIDDDYLKSSADTRISNGQGVIKIRSTDVDSNVTINNSTITLASANGTNGAYLGSEISVYNRISSKSFLVKIDYDINNTLEDLSTEPLGFSQEFFVVLKDFQDVYNLMPSGASLGFEFDIQNSESSASILFEVDVDHYITFSESSASLLFQIDVAAVEQIESIIFVDSNNNLPDNVNNYILSENDINHFVYVAIKNLETDTASILIGQPDGSDLNYLELPIKNIATKTGELSLYYDHREGLIEAPEDFFYLTDVDDPKQRIVAQLFQVSEPMLWNVSPLFDNGIDTIKIYLKNIGSNEGEITVSAIVTEVNEHNIPVNIDFSTGSIYWNGVNTVQTLFTGIAFVSTIGYTEVELVAQSFTEDLTLKDAIDLYPGKKYLLILALQSSNDGDSKIQVFRSNDAKIASRRYVFNVDEKDNNFATTDLATGGLQFNTPEFISLSEPDKSIAFDMYNNSVQMYSSHSSWDKGQVAVYFRDNGSLVYNRLATIEVDKFEGYTRAITFGERHFNQETFGTTSIDVSTLILTDEDIEEDINVFSKDNLTTEDLKITDSVFDSTPLLGTIGDWRQSTIGRYTQDNAEHVLIAASSSTSTTFIDGSSALINNFILQASIFTSQEATPFLGGQADHPTIGYEAWVGQDIFYADPTYDDSAYAEVDYNLSQIKDYGEGEFYIMISTDAIQHSTVDITRNDALGLKNPNDFIRVSIDFNNNIKIYRNRDTDSSTEEVYQVIYDIEQTIQTIVGDRNNDDVLDYTKDTEIRGRLIVSISNEDNKDTRIKISKIVLLDAQLTEVVILDDYLDKKLLPQTNDGFYVALGNRVRNLDRNTSSFSFWDLKIIPDNGDEVNLSLEDDLYLYNEIQGLEYDERIIQYPNLLDLTLNGSDSDYYDKAEHAYVVLDNDTNCKFYLLAPQGAYTLGDEEINRCDQVLQNPDDVVCYGIVISNLANEDRAAGDTQRAVSITNTSGNVGQDYDPPIGDRRNYTGVQGLSNSSVVYWRKAINLMTNARSYSKDHWICSEWQWYEALSPWAGESDWVNNSNTNIPPSIRNNMRESNPLSIDKIRSSTQTIEFQYILSDQALKGNMEVYFGVSNFKPAYRTYNEASVERLVYDPIANTNYYDATYNFWKKSINDKFGPVSGNPYAGNYDPDLGSVAFMYGEEDNTVNVPTVDGYEGVSGQKVAQSVAAKTYQYMLPYEQPDDDVSDATLNPLDFNSRNFFHVALNNNDETYISSKFNSANIVRNKIYDSSTGNFAISLDPEGSITIQITRGTQTISEGIKIATNGDITITTSDDTGDYDAISIYQGTGDTKKSLITFYTPTTNIQVSGIFDMLYPYWGIRERYDTGTQDVMINNVRIAATEENSLVPVSPESVSWWLQQEGSLQDDDALFGRYAWTKQTADSSGLIVLTAKNPHAAQSFMIPSDDARPQESYSLKDSVAKLSYLSIKKTGHVNSNYRWRVIIAPDNNDSPDVGGISKSIYINDISEETFRPQTDIEIFDPDILGVAFKNDSEGSEHVNFIFDPPLALEFDTKYWMILTHPQIASSQPMSAISETLRYDYSNDNEKIVDIYIQSSNDDKSRPKRSVPNDTCLTWNIDNRDWDDRSNNLWFKIYRDFYINENPKIDNEIQKLFVGAYSNSHTISAFSEISDNMRVDNQAPWDPDLSYNPPRLEAAGDPTRRNQPLYIYARDTEISTGYGSDIWRFRIGYFDEYGNIKFSSWQSWIDDDNDNRVYYEWVYNSNNFEDIRIFAQIQDFVGNIIETNELTINIDYEFLIDTQAPYLTRVRIEGDASLDTDPNEKEIINKRKANVSLYALDATSAVKDMRYNLDLESDSDGNLIFSSWMPYSRNIIRDLGSSDGVKTLTFQFRDYADNADQAKWQHVLKEEYASKDEIVTAMASLTVLGLPALYYTTIVNLTRTGLTGSTISLSGHAAFTAYSLKNSFDVTQSLNNNETLNVYVNNVLKIEGSNNDWVRDTVNNAIIFNNPLNSTDIVLVNTFENVCRLYRLTTTPALLYQFSTEGEHICTCMQVYDSKIYLGFENGNIYSYNGVKLRLEYTLLNTTGTFPNLVITRLPVSCMTVHQFGHETRSFLYVGSLNVPKVWRYGGNAAISAYNWTALSVINSSSNIINSVTYNFSDQTHVLSLGSYNDNLMIGMAANSAVFQYKRTVDNTGTSETESMNLYLLKDVSPDHSGSKITSLKSFGTKIYAGTDAASIFYFNEQNEKQPNSSIWSLNFEISDNFLIDPGDWRYYETLGRTNPTKSSKVSIESHLNSTLGLIDYYTLDIEANTGDISEFYLTSEDGLSLFNSLNNSTGYTLEWEAAVEIIGSGDEGYQAIRIEDGTHDVELRMSKNRLTLVNGGDTFDIDISNVDTHSLEDTYFFQEEFDESDLSYSSKIKFYNLLEENPSDIDFPDNLDDAISIKVKQLELGEYPYIEISGLDFMGDDNAFFEISMKVQEFSFDQTKFYLQWRSATNQPFIRERQYVFIIPNDNVYKTFKFNPGWNDTVSDIRILIEPTDDAITSIDYIRISGKTTKSFDVTAMNIYRLAVKDTNVDLYINDSIYPALSKKQWLNENVVSKRIIFGKIEQSEKQVKLKWKGIRLYSGDDLSPYKINAAGWTYMATFANGSEVQNLLESRDSLIAMLKPVNISKELDTVSDLNPRSYRLDSPQSIFWVFDATYPSEVVQILSSTTWGDDIYSSGQIGSINNNIIDIDLVIIIDNSNRTTINQLSNMISLCKDLIDELRLNKNNNYDNIAIITTDESNSYPAGGLLLDYSSDKADIFDALDTISVGLLESSMDNALLCARSVLDTSVARNDALGKYVLIFSDGNFTASIQSNSVVTSDIIRDGGSNIICIGFNDDNTPQAYNSANLTAIADTDLFEAYSGNSKDFILSSTNTSDRNIIITTKTNIVDTIVADDILTDVGNLYNRRKTHAYDEVIKDTAPPQINLVIKPDENAGGIRIYELNVFIEDTSEGNV